MYVFLEWGERAADTGNEITAEFRLCCIFPCSYFKMVTGLRRLSFMYDLCHQRAFLESLSPRMTWISKHYEQCRFWKFHNITTMIIMEQLFEQPIIHNERISESWARPLIQPFYLLFFASVFVMLQLYF